MWAVGAVVAAAVVDWVAGYDVSDVIDESDVNGHWPKGTAPAAAG